MVACSIKLVCTFLLLVSIFLDIECAAPKKKPVTKKPVKAPVEEDDEIDVPPMDKIPSIKEVQAVIGPNLKEVPDLNIAKLKKDKLPVPKITPKQAEAIAKFKKERDIEKKKQKKKGRQLAEGLGLAGALAGLGELTGAVTAIFGVINYIPQLFTGFYTIIKTTQDIFELLGINQKQHALLIDNVCHCKIWVRTVSMWQDSGWHELEEDGFIVKFLVRFGGTFIDNWTGHFKKDSNQKVFTQSLYGNGKAREIWNLYVCKEPKINRIDFETHRVDGLGGVIYW